MNPSFENYTSCPGGMSGQTNRATSWDTCRASADYFHLCGASTSVQTPKNLFGIQKPKNGNAYCGFICYDNGGLYREFIIGTLSSPLNPAQKYFISFNVNRADSNFLAGYSINKLGIKFTKVKQAYAAIDNSAHLWTNAVVTDTINWTSIKGSFVADSAYQYIMLGNFFDDINTTKINDSNGPLAYYYLDDVCVSTDSAYAYSYAIGIVEFDKRKERLLFPNPASNTIFYNGSEKNKPRIFDVSGKECGLFEYENGKFYIKTQDWPDGIYFVLTDDRKYKVIINHKTNN